MEYDQNGTQSRLSFVRAHTRGITGGLSGSAYFCLGNFLNEWKKIGRLWRRYWVFPRRMGGRCLCIWPCRLILSDSLEEYGDSIIDLHSLSSIIAYVILHTAQPKPSFASHLNI